MRELLELIIKNIATVPEEVIIDEAEENGMVVYTITVSPEDMGRIIGKSGKVIKSIRNIAHVAAIRQGKRFRINVAEVGGSSTDVESGNDDGVIQDNSTSQEISSQPAQDDLITEALDTETEA